MADDYQADTGTTGTVAIGGSVTGEIESGSNRRSHHELKLPTTLWE